MRNTEQPPLDQPPLKYPPTAEMCDQIQWYIGKQAKANPYELGAFAATLHKKVRDFSERDKAGQYEPQINAMSELAQMAVACCYDELQ